MACHSVGGIGALGGGQLGPDLTAVGARYGGAAGLDAFVAGTPTPTMKAVWSQHPLTTEERASVVAFLGQAGRERTSGASDMATRGSGCAGRLWCCWRSRA